MRTDQTLIVPIVLAAVASCRAEEPPKAEKAIQESPTARWCVTGEVRDDSGAPLEGVTVTAHCGAGTLRRTGQAVTDADGKYVLRFGPGMLFQNDHSGLQAATISPHKTGMVEKKLHRQGDLRMAKRPPDEDELGSWGPPEAIVYPDEPRRVDFVMVPAATISGRLVDADGKPIIEHYISVDAEELPPSSSVLANMKTDQEGRFRFTEIAPGEVWLSIRTPEDRMREVQTERMKCEAKQVYEVELTYDPGPPASLALQQTHEP